MVSHHSVPNTNYKVKDGAWYYPQPSSGAANIKDHVAFYKVRSRSQAHRDTTDADLHMIRTSSRSPESPQSMRYDHNTVLFATVNVEYAWDLLG